MNPRAWNNDSIAVVPYSGRCYSFIPGRIDNWCNSIFEACSLRQIMYRERFAGAQPLFPVSGYSCLSGRSGCIKLKIGAAFIQLTSLRRFGFAGAHALTARSSVPGRVTALGFGCGCEGDRLGTKLRGRDCVGCVRQPAYLLSRRAPTLSWRCAGHCMLLVSASTGCTMRVLLAVPI